MYDIGIIGAGPAGATLARLWADRFRILLIDRDRPKCCGGILAPEAQKMLSCLDLALPKSVLVDPQPFAVAIQDAASDLLRHYSRQYINIDRYALDRWLVSLIPSNVDRRSGAVYQRSEPTEKGFRIHFVHQGEQRQESVKLLIGADGADSKVRREFFTLPDSLKRYIAIQHWYKKEELEMVRPRGPVNIWNDYFGLFDPQITDYYAWAIPKNDQLIIGAALPMQPGASELFEKVKPKFYCSAVRLGKPFFKEAGQIVRPLSSDAICLGDKKVALIGEAAGWISPSSAEGVSFALASAIALSKTINGHGSDLFNIPEYRKNVQNLYWAIWRKNLKKPAMFNPWLRKIVMKSNLTTLTRETVK